MKILIVDDDKSLNRGICTFLNSQNIETDSAFNGKEGTKLIIENNYELILTDLQMPEVDGLELLEFVKQSGKNIPVIIMTAFASIENAVEAMKKGAFEATSIKLHTQNINNNIQTG